MARYEIEFTLNGQRYHTSGVSSYPPQETIEKGEFSDLMAKDNVFLFISGYMDVCNLKGQVDSESVTWTIHKE